MSTATAPAPDVDAFLDRLQEAGYGVGVRERLLAHALLARCAERGDLPDEPGDRLRLLEPLLSRSEHEQRHFPSVVDAFLRQRAARGGGDDDGGDDEGERGRRRRRRIRWRAFWGSFAAAVLILVAVLVWPPGPGQGREEKGETSTAAAADPSRDSLRTTTAGDVDTTAPPPIYVPVGSFPDAAELASAPPTTVPGALRWVLGGMGLLLAGAVAGWLVRRRYRVAYLQSVRTDEALEQHVLRDPDPVALPIPDAAVRPASRMLRQRIAGSREVLDLRATLHATIRAGGALTARYRPLHQTPEYVVLVDRVSARDHQAAFHELLVGALARFGVAVDLFYYEGSPESGCWRPRRTGDDDEEEAGGPARVLLTVAQLSNRYGGHRLLVFGDAACAFDPLRGRPAPWTRHRGQFPSLAWFSPLPLPSWGAAEAGVDGLGFLLLPAQPESLEALGEWLASDRATLQAEVDWPGPYPASLRGNAASWVARQAAPPDEALEDLLFELRTYLGPARFQWLCACAIFPAVSWPLTLSLGREVLGGDGPADAPALARGVAALGALPWFRYGRMPGWLREALLDRLDAEREARLRAVVERRLSAALADAPGAMIAEVSVRRRRLLAWFGRRRGMARDVVLAGFLEKGLPNRLAQRLPKPLQRLLFRGGRSLYGLRPGVPAAVALASVLCLTAAAPGVWEAWAVADDGEVPALALYSEMKGTPGRVLDAAFSPDGWRVAVAFSDGVARIWSVFGKDTVISIRGHSGVVNSAAFSPDGRWIVTASDDSTVRVWSADGSGNPVVFPHAGQVLKAAFSPDGRQIVTASMDGAVLVWPLDPGRSAPRVLLDGDSPVRDATFSRDGRWIVAAMSANARVWRADSSTVPVLLRGHTAPVVSAAFSPNGQFVVTASSDRTARVWQVDGAGTPIVLQHAERVRSAAYSPDGRFIITVIADGTARIWRADGSRQVLILASVGSQPENAQFSPSGRWIVSANGGGVRLWGREPGVRVNIATCNTSRATFTLARDVADRLARDATLAPVVYEPSAWDLVRLGYPPEPGEVRYEADDTLARTAAERLVTRLDSLSDGGGSYPWRALQGVSDPKAPLGDAYAGHPGITGALTAPSISAGVCAAETPVSTVAVDSLARVSVYYKAVADSAVARQVAQGLAGRGYAIRGPSLEPDAADTGAENIRYFHDEDLPAAQAVAEVVREVLADAGAARFQPRVADNSGRQSMPRNQIEIWLPDLAPWRT
ncbi:MAG TPA: hypothetical protein VF142_13880, partial [Longimicrobium sp.]